MVQAENTGFGQLGEPNDEVGISGSNDSRLCLYTKTFLTKILQGLNQKPRLSGKQGDQALPLLVFGFEQVFRDFNNGVGGHSDAAVIQKGNFQIAEGFRFPFVFQKYGIPH